MYLCLCYVGRGANYFRMCQCGNASMLHMRLRLSSLTRLQAPDAASCPGNGCICIISLLLSPLCKLRTKPRHSSTLPIHLPPNKPFSLVQQTLSPSIAQYDASSSPLVSWASPQDQSPLSASLLSGHRARLIKPHLSRTISFRAGLGLAGLSVGSPRYSWPS